MDTLLLILVKAHKLLSNLPHFAIFWRGGDFCVSMGFVLFYVLIQLIHLVIGPNFEYRDLRFLRRYVVGCRTRNRRLR